MNMDNKGTCKRSPRHGQPVRRGAGGGAATVGLKRPRAAGAHESEDEQQRRPGGLHWQRASSTVLGLLLERPRQAGLLGAGRGCTEGQVGRH